MKLSQSMTHISAHGSAKYFDNFGGHLGLAAIFLKILKHANLYSYLSEQSPC
mgnify:CR=1 FL=1